LTLTCYVIRLQKDVEILKNMSGIVIHRGMSPSSIVIQFVPDGHPSNGIATIDSNYSDYQLFNVPSTLPTRFAITVPRFYPHNPPAVRCIDPEICFHPYINADGTVYHASIAESWTPIQSLHTVVIVLNEIRNLMLNGFSTLPATMEIEVIPGQVNLNPPLIEERDSINMDIV
jgi:hypothetical protein